MKKKVDIHSKKTSKKGLAGFVEGFLRRNRGSVTFLLLSPIVLAYIFCISVSSFPCFYILLKFWSFAEATVVSKAVYLSLGLGLSFLAFIFSMIHVVPLMNKVLLLPFGGKVKEARVISHSFETIPWYYHNAMVQLARYTVLDFLAPTPFLVWFYRLMGMKIGKGVIFNSTNISDPCLLEVGDYAVIGGSATIFAHYAMGGFLIIKRTVIKKGATIGLNANIMGDTIVGENQTVAPNSILLPKTRIEDRVRGIKK